MAVELRNRLSERVGTKLPTTVAFDSSDGARRWRSCCWRSFLQRARHVGKARQLEVRPSSKTEWLRSIEALLRGA